jgi:hypothetical protein
MPLDTNSQINRSSHEITPVFLDAIDAPRLSEVLGEKAREDDLLVINFVTDKKDTQAENLANSKALQG